MRSVRDLGDLAKYEARERGMGNCATAERLMFMFCRYPIFVLNVVLLMSILYLFNFVYYIFNVML